MTNNKKTDSGKKLQIVTNQELRNAFINCKTDFNNTKTQYLHRSIKDLDFLLKSHTSKLFCIIKWGYFIHRGMSNLESSVFF